jgi:hypothetical protein
MVLGTEAPMTKPRLSSTELRPILDEYLNGLRDDEDSKNERFLTPRGFAESVFEDLIDWLEYLEKHPDEPVKP